MKNKSKSKITIGVLGTIICILFGVLITALTILQIRTNNILNDYSSIYSNEKYALPVSIDNIDVLK